MQKASIITIEWDKRIKNILYIGTKSSIIKLYDSNQKKIVQDLSFNKMYPLITCVHSFASSEKVLILMASKPNISSSNKIMRNGQMIVCNLNNVNLNLTIEKLVDLDGFYSQCVVDSSSSGSVFLGNTLILSFFLLD